MARFAFDMWRGKRREEHLDCGRLDLMRHPIGDSLPNITQLGRATARHITQWLAQIGTIY